MKNDRLKKGEISQEFKSNPYRLAQKECEGNWTKKGSTAFLGYKDHPCIDAFWKLMRGYDPQITASQRAGKAREGHGYARKIHREDVGRKNERLLEVAKAIRKNIWSKLVNCGSNCKYFK
ncbi:hypothetical protein FACS189454_10120 [Planctomycetales bacterium]|nr:hypothetical protein FACS189454_10120 [Planctomycetales bacterium]